MHEFVGPLVRLLLAKGMVCPLRFVLLGASAAVALCGVVFVTHNSAKRSHRQGRVKVCKQL